MERKRCQGWETENGDQKDLEKWSQFPKYLDIAAYISDS